MKIFLGGIRVKMTALKACNISQGVKGVLVICHIDVKK